LQIHAEFRELALSRPQVPANIEGRQSPCRVPLVPLQRKPRQHATQIIQYNVPAERQLYTYNLKSERCTREAREILAREVFKTRGGQMPLVCRIDIGIVRAEVRSSNEDVGAIAGNPVDLGHGAHGILQMLDDVRHVYAGKAVLLERPRVTVEVPYFIRSGMRGGIDSDGIGFDLTGAAADVQNHP